MDITRAEIRENICHLKLQATQKIRQTHLNDNSVGYTGQVRQLISIEMPIVFRSVFC
jgi:hypothetical protein